MVTGFLEKEDSLVMVYYMDFSINILCDVSVDRMQKCELNDGTVQDS